MYLLFSNIQAAQEIAYTLQGNWDGCNGVVFRDEVDELLLELARAQVASLLSESLEYCCENERCHNTLKFITPPPNAKSRSLQWYRWQRKTLLEDIQDLSKYSLFILDEGFGRYLTTLTSVEMLLVLVYYQRQWKQVLRRKSIFKLIKSNPRFNLEIGSNGLQFKESLVLFSPKCDSSGTNNRTVKQDWGVLNRWRKPGCQFVISVQDPTALFGQDISQRTKDGNEKE
jgi:hypothetical protein